MQVIHHRDAGSFLGRAKPWLMRAEVENNLILGISDALLAQPQPIPDLYLATVEDGGDIVACALRTPPHKAVITRANDAALARLVEDLAARDERLPAVLGPEPDVRRFANLWAARVGRAVRPGMSQRVFDIRSVRPLPWRVPGVFRRATDADLPILVPWITAFNQEAHVTQSPEPDALARERVAHGRLFVWEDDWLVSMAAHGTRMPSGAGVNLVYTPPALRGRGYASACVAALTGHLLATGLAYCCLFTDLANPTSNSIYQRIGYRPVCDMSDYLLDEGTVS